MRILQDIRSSWRFWSRNPQITAAAIGILALGIGACTTIFSVAEAWLWRPLPYPEPDRLVMLWETPPRSAEDSPADWRVASFPVLADWRREIGELDGLAASRPWRPILTGGDELVSVAGARVTADFFSVLGVEPRLGRGFLPGEDGAGAAPVVVLSHHFWQQRFGGDPEVLGKTLSFDDSGRPVAATVVGVLPREVRIGGPVVFEEVEVLMPVEPDPRRGQRYFRVFGRLAPGAGLEALRARLEVLARDFRDGYPENHAGWGAGAERLAELVAAPMRPALRLLLTAASLLFLVAVANVAILRRIQEADRCRDLAVRVVLGARPVRIWRQMLVESLLVSAAGAAAGVLLTAVALNWLESVGLFPGTRIAVDRWGLAYTAGLGLLTTAAFGVLPARRFFKMDLASVVQAAGPSRRRVGQPAGFGPRRWLVLAETSLALVLVAAASLMLQSLRYLLRVDPGFDPRGVVTMRLRIPPSLHPDGDRLDELWRSLPAAVESLPQVHSAGLVNHLPMQGTSLGTRAWAADAGPAAGLRVEVRGVSRGYFRGVGMALLAGRDFSSGEIAEDLPAVVVSAAAARRLWPDAEAVGQRLDLDWSGSGARQVVGVVGDVKHRGVAAAADPAVYLPFGQTPHPAMTLVARSFADRPAALASEIRARVLSLDGTFVIDQVRTLPQVVGATLAQPRSHALALAAFALVSVCLSAGGAYTVVAYSVARRRHDFSVRLALGAHPRDLVKGVAAEGLRDAVSGVGIGLILFVFLARLLSDLLFGVRAGDPWVLTAMSVMMVAVAWVAAYLPARKVAGIDPAPSLRTV